MPETEHHSGVPASSSTWWHGAAVATIAIVPIAAACNYYAYLLTENHTRVPRSHCLATPGLPVYVQVAGLAGLVVGILAAISIQLLLWTAKHRHQAIRPSLLLMLQFMAFVSLVCVALEALNVNDLIPDALSRPALAEIYGCGA